MTLQAAFPSASPAGEQMMDPPRFCLARGSAGRDLQVYSGNLWASSRSCRVACPLRRRAGMIQRGVGCGEARFVTGKVTAFSGCAGREGGGRSCCFADQQGLTRTCTGLTQPRAGHRPSTLTRVPLGFPFLNCFKNGTDLTFALITEVISFRRANTDAG